MTRTLHHLAKLSGWTCGVLVLPLVVGACTVVAFGQESDPDPRPPTTDTESAKKELTQEVDDEVLTYSRIWARLLAAVERGDLTRAQAEAAMGAIKTPHGAGESERDEAGNRADLDAVWAELQAQVEAGEISQEDAEAKMLEIKGVELRRMRSFDEFQDLNLDDLPATSTGNDTEGPAATFIFGWAANATHRFMDNSHRGEPRIIQGVSFRLDHRGHQAIGRSWSSVTVRVAHGHWDSIQYNQSTEFELADERVVVFDQPWSFPALNGYPPLTPASWGGVQNSLTFRFDEPWEYNGEDAIFLEFVFSGGTADDGREWRGETPFGFEYYLDSMPEIGGWRMPLDDTEGRFKGPLYLGSSRVPAATSYTAGGQSVWTSAAKGMPYIRYDE